MLLIDRSPQFTYGAAYRSKGALVTAPSCDTPAPLLLSVITHFKSFPNPAVRRKNVYPCILDLVATLFTFKVIGSIQAPGDICYFNSIGNPASTPCRISDPCLQPRFDLHEARTSARALTFRRGRLRRTETSQGTYTNVGCAPGIRLSVLRMLDRKASGAEVSRWTCIEKGA